MRAFKPGVAFFWSHFEAAVDNEVRHAADALAELFPLGLDLSHVHLWRSSGGGGAMHREQATRIDQRNWQMKI